MDTWEPATALTVLFTVSTLLIAALWTWTNIFKACEPPAPTPPAQTQGCSHQTRATSQQTPGSSSTSNGSSSVVARCCQACERGCWQADDTDVGTCHVCAHWHSRHAWPGVDNRSTFATPAGSEVDVSDACCQGSAIPELRAPRQEGFQSISNAQPGTTSLQHSEMPFRDQELIGRSSSSQSLPTPWNDTRYAPLHNVSLGLYNTMPATGYNLPSLPFGTAAFPPSISTSESGLGRPTSLYGNFRNARLAVLSSRSGINPAFLASLCEQSYRTTQSGPVSASSPLRGVLEDLNTTATHYASCPASPTHQQGGALLPAMPAIPEIQHTTSTSSNFAQ